jgi:hypothetical protein
MAVDEPLVCLGGVEAAAQNAPHRSVYGDRSLNTYCSSCPLRQ